MISPKLRVARPTDDIEALIPFYRDGLGFDILHRFDGHDGFDGVMLGRSDAPYHFEFTQIARARSRSGADTRSPSGILLAGTGRMAGGN